MQETKGAVGVELRGVHHVGVPVRSLERSLAWFRDAFGIEPELVVESEGPETSAAVQLEGARIGAAFLDIGNTIIELLEYREPVGEDFRLRNCDVGAVHIALEVASIHDAHERLRELGAAFSVPPTRIEDAPLEGHWFCYFRDPNGIQYELFQRPQP